MIKICLLHFQAGEDSDNTSSSSGWVDGVWFVKCKTEEGRHVWYLAIVAVVGAGLMFRLCSWWRGDICP